MKKTMFSFVAVTFLLLSSQNVDAKKIGGNYVNSDGCLVVWSQHTFLGISVPFTYTEVVFCNDNGSPVNFEL